MTPIFANRRVHKALGLLGALSPLLVLLLVLSPVGPAQASGTEITACSTDTALHNAVAGGGLVTFNCGGTHAPVTITLGSALSPVSGTTIDGSNGGHTVVLDGQGSTRLVQVSAGTQVTLAHLVLTNGAAVDGSCVIDHAVLELDNVEVHHCQAGIGKHGGALYVDGGSSAALNHANLHDNSAGVSGGAIYSLAALTVTNSYFAHNAATNNDGGAIWGVGRTRIDGSTFFSNTVPSGWGGALYNQGTYSVTNSALTENRAGWGGGGIQTYAGSSELYNVTLSGNTAAFGGGLYAAQAVVTLTQSTLSGNSAGEGGGVQIATGAQADFEDSTLSGNMATEGGGFYTEVTTTLTFSNSRLADNSAVDEGGGGFNQGKPVYLRGVTLSGNIAGSYGGGLANDTGASIVLVYAQLSANAASEGGAIANFAGAHLTVGTSTLADNSANGYGGGLYNAGAAYIAASTLTRNSLKNNGSSGGGIYDGGELDLVEDTLSGNSAYYGGGLAEQGRGTVRDSTFSNNRGTAGGAVRTPFGLSPTLALTDTILAYSPTGGNCSGTPPSSQYSISSDDTCALSGTIRGNLDPNGLDPVLTALGQYGGPTLVHMLEHNSPAIDGVLGSTLYNSDQRGRGRPIGLGFDIGSVERQPDDSDLAPWLWLPLTRR